MNRFEIAKMQANPDYKPVYKPTPLEKQPLSRSAEKINRIADATTMDEWIRLRQSSLGGPRPAPNVSWYGTPPLTPRGLEVEEQWRRQQIAMEQARAVQAEGIDLATFSQDYIAPAARALASRIDQDIVNHYEERNNQLERQHLARMTHEATMSMQQDNT